MHLPAELCKMQRKKRETDGFSKNILMTPPGSHPTSGFGARHGLPKFFRHKKRRIVQNDAANWWTTICSIRTWYFFAIIAAFLYLVWLFFSWFCPWFIWCWSWIATRHLIDDLRCLWWLIFAFLNFVYFFGSLNPIKLLQIISSWIKFKSLCWIHL